MMTASLVVLAAGCGAAADTNRAVEGPALRSELESALGLSLSEPPSVPNPGLANVTATYVGRSLNEKLLVIVFDSTAATRQIDSGGRGEGFDRVRVIKRANVAILYQVKPSTTSRQALIRRVIEREAPPRA